MARPATEFVGLVSNLDRGGFGYYASIEQSEIYEQILGTLNSKENSTLITRKLLKTLLSKGGARFHKQAEKAEKLLTFKLAEVKEQKTAVLADLKELAIGRRILENKWAAQGKLDVDRNRGLTSKLAEFDENHEKQSRLRRTINVAKGLYLLTKNAVKPERRRLTSKELFRTGSAEVENKRAKLDNLLVYERKLENARENISTAESLVNQIEFYASAHRSQLLASAKRDLISGLAGKTSDLDKLTVADRVLVNTYINEFKSVLKAAGVEPSPALVALSKRYEKPSRFGIAIGAVRNLYSLAKEAVRDKAGLEELVSSLSAGKGFVASSVIFWNYGAYGDDGDEWEYMSGSANSQSSTQNPTVQEILAGVKLEGEGKDGGVIADVDKEDALVKTKDTPPYNGSGYSVGNNKRQTQTNGGSPIHPGAQPRAQPTAQPTAQPRAQPTAQPTAQPRAQPTAQSSQADFLRQSVRFTRPPHSDNTDPITPIKLPGGESSTPVRALRLTSGQSASGAKESSPGSKLKPGVFFVPDLGGEREATVVSEPKDSDPRWQAVLTLADEVKSLEGKIDGMIDGNWKDVGLDKTQEAILHHGFSVSNKPYEWRVAKLEIRDAEGKKGQASKQIRNRSKWIVRKGEAKFHGAVYKIERDRRKVYVDIPKRPEIDKETGMIPQEDIDSERKILLDAQKIYQSMHKTLEQMCGDAENAILKVYQTGMKSPEKFYETWRKKIEAHTGHRELKSRDKDGKAEYEVIGGASKRIKQLNFKAKEYSFRAKTSLLPRLKEYHLKKRDSAMRAKKELEQEIETLEGTLSSWRTQLCSPQADSKHSLAYKTFRELIEQSTSLDSICVKHSRKHHLGWRRIYEPTRTKLVLTALVLAGGVKVATNKLQDDIPVNEDPTLKEGQHEMQVEKGYTDTIDLDEHIEDKDGDALDYEIIENEDNLQAKIEDSSLIVDASDPSNSPGVGQHYIKIKATDGNGGEFVYDFPVEVENSHAGLSVDNKEFKGFGQNGEKPFDIEVSGSSKQRLVGGELYIAGASIPVGAEDITQEVRESGDGKNEYQFVMKKTVSLPADTPAGKQDIGAGVYDEFGQLSKSPETILDVPDNQAQVSVSAEDVSILEGKLNDLRTSKAGRIEVPISVHDYDTPEGDNVGSAHIELSDGNNVLASQDVPIVSGQKSVGLNYNEGQPIGACRFVAKYVNSEGEKDLVDVEGRVWGNSPGVNIVGQEMISEGPDTAKYEVSVEIQNDQGQKTDYTIDTGSGEYGPFTADEPGIYKHEIDVPYGENHISVEASDIDTEGNQGIERSEDYSDFYVDGTPVVIGSLEDMINVEVPLTKGFGRNTTLQVAALFRDPNGDIVTVDDTKLIFDGGEVSYEDGVLYIKAHTAGEYDLFVPGEDQAGHSVQAHARINVVERASSTLDCYVDAITGEMSINGRVIDGAGYDPSSDLELIFAQDGVEKKSIPIVPYDGVLDDDIPIKSKWMPNLPVGDYDTWIKGKDRNGVPIVKYVDQVPIMPCEDLPETNYDFITKGLKDRLLTDPTANGERITENTTWENVLRVTGNELGKYTRFTSNKWDQAQKEWVEAISFAYDNLIPEHKDDLDSLTMFPVMFGHTSTEETYYCLFVRTINGKEYIVQYDGEPYELEPGTAVVMPWDERFPEEHKAEAVMYSWMNMYNRMESDEPDVAVQTPAMNQLAEALGVASKWERGYDDYKKIMSSVKVCGIEDTELRHDANNGFTFDIGRFK